MMNNAKLRLEVVSPTTIKCGHIEWFALDTKLVGKVKALLEENNEWSMIFDTFSKRPYAHKYLEEKKKELGNKNIIGLDSEMIYKDYYELKTRLDKAVDTLLFCLSITKQEEEMSTDSRTRNEINTCRIELKKALNILRGEDK